MRGAGVGRIGLAAVAVALVAAAVASDLLISGFWAAHAMVTAIVSSLLVVLLSVAVIQVVLTARSERRWRLLAQSGLIELAEAAHATWGTLVEGLGAPQRASQPPHEVSSVLASAQEAPAIRRFAAQWFADRSHRKHMEDLLRDHLTVGRQILSSWAVVLTGSDRYAGIFDEHVEMYGRVDGLRQFLDTGYRRSDPRLQRSRTSREFAAPGGGEQDAWFLDNLLATIAIAADLEDRTWDLALAIAPEQWWDRRTADLAAPSRAG